MEIRSEKIGLDPEKLRQFLEQQMKDQPSPQQATAADGSASTNPSEGPLIEFDLIPEELEAYLDQFVIRQSEAKAVLCTKICTHFHLRW